MIARFGSFEYSLAERYRFDEELGRGGMGVVYLATDVRLDRPVAIKMLHPFLTNEVGVRRFESEIRIAAGLRHPNIVSLHESGEVDGRLFYVMDYLGGETLRARLEREKQLSVEDAVEITRQVANGLQYAHDHHVVHRDVKPDNIILVDGRACILDFGLARALGDVDTDRLTASGLSVGTPHYLSPEQASAEREVGPKADQYALACVFYELLVGEPPFTGPTASAIAMRHITATPVPIHARRKAAPPSMDAAVMRALEKVPADRFATVASFAAHLEIPGASSPLPAKSRTATIVAAVLCICAVALAIPARVVWNNARAITAQDSGGQSPLVTIRYDSTPLRSVVDGLAQRGAPRVVLGPGAESVYVTAAYANTPAIKVLRSVLSAHRFDLSTDNRNDVLVATLQRGPAVMSGPASTRTVVIALRYRRVADLLSLARVSLSDRGRIDADTLSNSLVITELSQLIDERIRFVNDLDNAVGRRRGASGGVVTAQRGNGPDAQPDDGASPVPAGKRRIAILAFANGSVGALASSLLPLRFVISDLLMTELASDSTFQFVEGDGSGTPVDAVAPSVAASVGQRLGAESAIVGSYVGDVTGRLRLSARVVDVKTRTVTHTEVMEGRQDSALAPIQTIAHRLFCDLKPARESLCAPSTLAQATSAVRIKLDVATMRTYSQALDEMDRRNYDEAARLFRTVLSRFPDFEPARRNLAKLAAPPVP